MKEQRASRRYALMADVKLSHESFGEYITTTTDASDSGVFIKVHDLTLPHLGSVMQVQIINTPEEMPVKDVKLARIVDGRGVGLAFCEWSK